MKGQKTGAIGIYDSGVGGVSFLWKMKQTLPQENVIYYGDLAYAPYGDQTPDFVRQRAQEVTEELLQKGCKAMVIACNTATSSAADFLRHRYPGFIILGMEPAIQLAVNQGEKKIIVLSTLITAKAKNTLELIEKNKEKAEIINLPCPGLMDLIEQIPSQPEAMGQIKAYMQDKIEGLVETGERAAVVLGCTHYILIQQELKAWYPNLSFYDGNQGTANYLVKRLKQEDLWQDETEKGSVSIVCSDHEIDFQEKIQLFLKKMDKLSIEG